MKVKTKKVYYCDYCKKHSLRSLAKHEKHCTGNPDRECRLECDTVDLPRLVEKYKRQLLREWDDVFNVWTILQQPAIQCIKDDTGNCPNCTLTIIRCAGLENCYSRGEFDYKKELESWWLEVNEHQRREDERSAMYGM